jgi:hypothetical protein
VTEIALMEYDSVFCANTGCVLHVSAGDPAVRGWGNWAQLADGTFIGRQRVEATMLCDTCARRILAGEVTLATRPNASAA